MFRANTDVHHFLDKKYRQKKANIAAREDLCWNEYKNSECLGYLQKNYIIPTSASQYYKYIPPFSGNLTNGCCWEIIWFTMMGFSLLYSSLLNHAKLARLKQSRKAIVAAAPFYFPYSIPQSSSEYICKIMSS